MSGLFDLFDEPAATATEAPKAKPSGPVAAPVAEIPWHDRVRRELNRLLGTSAALHKMLKRDAAKKGAAAVTYGRIAAQCPITLLLAEDAELKQVLGNSRVQCGWEHITLVSPSAPRWMEFYPLMSWAVRFVREMNTIVPREPVDLPVPARTALVVLHNIQESLR